jgi:hypothetical protein
MPSPADLPSVKAYGAASPECAGMSAALMGATEIGGLADQGKVTQGDFEAAYTTRCSTASPSTPCRSSPT